MDKVNTTPDAVTAEINRRDAAAEQRHDEFIQWRDAACEPMPPRYPQVRVSGAELVECKSVTAAVALVRRALADEVGTQVARDFAELAVETIGDRTPATRSEATFDLIRAWVTVA